MARTLFPRDLFAELDRLQRDMQQRLDLSPSIRGPGRDGFPAINVGSTPRSVELYAFAPGVDPASLDVQVEKGVLTISGERKPDAPAPEAGAIEAHYRNGVLHIGIPRQETALPRRIQVQ